MMRAWAQAYPTRPVRIRDTAGGAAAPAVRCKNLRRGSFIFNLPSHHSITSSRGPPMAVAP